MNRHGLESMHVDAQAVLRSLRVLRMQVPASVYDALSRIEASLARLLLEEDAANDAAEREAAAMWVWRGGHLVRRAVTS